MFFKQRKSQKNTFIAAICSSLFVCSCANDTATNNVSQVENSVNSLFSIASANALYCPKGSENVQLNLTNIQLKREQNSV